MDAAGGAPHAEFALVALTVTPPLAYVEAQPSTAVTYESRWLYAKIALWTLVCTPCAIRYFAAPAIASAGLKPAPGGSPPPPVATALHWLPAAPAMPISTGPAAPNGLAPLVTPGS